MLTKPISTILGIGPRRQSELQDAGVYSVGDLLTVSRSYLEKAVPGSGGEQIREWQDAASLLQAVGMTPHRAKELLAAGITSIGELSTLEFARAKKIIAGTTGRSRNAPTDTELSEILRDATVIRHSGTLNLAIRARDGKAMANARASIGPASATTDRRGRARLIRIPLGTKVPLVVDHPQLGTFECSDPPVLPDSSIRAGAVFELGRNNLVPGRRLSEYRGDTLSIAQGVQSSVETLAEDALREGDLLAVRAVRKTAVRLVSFLRDFLKGELVVYEYKVSPDRLPSPPTVGQGYLYRKGQLKPHRVDPAAVALYRNLRRVMMETPGDQLGGLSLARLAVAKGALSGAVIQKREG